MYLSLVLLILAALPSCGVSESRNDGLCESGLIKPGYGVCCSRDCGYCGGPSCSTGVARLQPVALDFAALAQLSIMDVIAYSQTMWVAYYRMVRTSIPGSRTRRRGRDENEKVPPAVLKTQAANRVETRRRRSQAMSQSMAISPSWC